MEKGISMSRRGFLGLAGALAGGSMLTLAGCGSGNAGSSTAPSASGESSPASESVGTAPASSASTAAADRGGKSLIALWSWSGNTLKVAERISELSGAEVYRIESADPYPEDYDECADRAKRERDDGVFPEIANPVEDWDGYDTIFLGYPIWWYQLPMIVQGFVRDHDWAGKTIVPFNTHEGSGDGGTYDDLREMTGRRCSTAWQSEAEAWIPRSTRWMSGTRGSPETRGRWNGCFRKADDDGSRCNRVCGRGDAGYHACFMCESGFERAGFRRAARCGRGFLGKRGRRSGQHPANRVHRGGAGGLPDSIGRARQRRARRVRVSRLRGQRRRGHEGGVRVPALRLRRSRRGRALRHRLPDARLGRARRRVLRSTAR